MSDIRVATFAPDLMDQSKIRAAFPDAKRLRSTTQLSGCDADVVIVDLGRPGVLDAVPEIIANGIRVVGFASHVDDELIGLAWAAGATEVLPRSVFFKRLSDGTLTL